LPHANPSIIFCTTCKGRAQHLEQTLPRNLVDNARYANCKFLLLDYGSRDHLATYLKTAQRGAMESGRLIVYHHPTVNAFRMSHAKNMAHRLAILEGADILVNLDADNSTGQNFACYVAEQLTNLEGTFLWANAKSVVGRARQGLAGRIAISRNAFLKVGGYDERYIVWAPEDEDLKARMRRLGYEGIPIDGQYLYVIHHKDGLRFKEYPHAKPTPEAEAEAMKTVREATTVIANDGNFGCGTVYRNYGATPLRLAPLPTRIFGIGMHKTATTSLHTAFKMLGLDSAHWTGPWWAKRIWEEMVFGRSLTLEKHYALCDLPFTLLYKQLDRAYPGSKFVLTLRNEENWIESVRRHWAVNSQRFEWDADCFTHRVHNLLYGRKTFDAEMMLARFRQHNAEVAEYFKNRPDDLLVFDMDAGAGWPELCGFFNWAIPQAPYPREFSTRMVEAAGAGAGGGV
jgi:hypothetical protein